MNNDLLDDFSHKLDKMNRIIVTTLKLVSQCKLTLEGNAKS